MNDQVKSKLSYCFEEQGNLYFEKQYYSESLNYYNQALALERRTSILNNAGLAYQNINNFI